MSGPSGSGKSTLLSLLGAIETPTSGKILLEGVDIATLSDKQRTLLRRHRIGFVFQAFNLLPTLTALENVALPMELDGISEAEAKERASAALEVVGSGLVAEITCPACCPAASRQRVAVARALAIQPAVLLADEPTGNLDSVGAEQVVRLLRELVDKPGPIGRHRDARYASSRGDGSHRSAPRRTRGERGSGASAVRASRRGSEGRLMLFFRLGWREIRKRPGRALLTLSSIVIGVAAVVRSVVHDADDAPRL